MKHIALIALLPAVALAQSSRIDEVLVYPGGAQVTRLAGVTAGARELVLSCLTARFDPDSLQISAPAGVKLGPVQVETLPRERTPDCATSPLDEQLRKLESQRDQLTSESSALDTSLGYLKALGSGEARATPAAGIAAAAEGIRKAAQDALLRQAQLRRQLAELDRQLAPLRGERERLVQANPQWRSLRVRLSAPPSLQGAELKLSYRITQAGWAPSYRALLDTAAGALTLERLAQVSQQSGEDWKNVKLRLSTASAAQKVGPKPPWPWLLDLQRSVPPAMEMRAKAMPAPPPAPVMALASRMADDDAEAERFDASVFQGSHATEFLLPLRVSIDSGTQRASLALGQEKLPARVLTRVQPQGEAAAYLVAALARPAGDWPRGPLQLLRDGAFVGSSQLNVAGGDARLELLELPFGRDDAVRVQAEPEQRNAGNTGFIGTRAEHKYARAWVVENRHAAGITLQLIESAPVSQHEDIKVQAQFSPAPTTQAWRKQPGLVLWELPLAAGASQRFRADYLISAPKEAQVTGLR